MPPLILAIGQSTLVWGFLFSILTVIELAVPRGRQPFAARVQGMAFWALAIPVTAIGNHLLDRLWASLDVAPLIRVPLDMPWAGWAAAIAAPLTAALVADFFFYWCHRAQHRFLWRFHAVHHAIRDMSAVNSYHHFSEFLVQFLLIGIPTSLIVADPGRTTVTLGILLALQPIFLHSPTRLHLGPLRLLFADNRYHRIHHSVEERHFDHNFGAFTTLWDRVFGTMHMPGAGEWPDVGLAEIDQPRDVRAWVTLPWRMPRPETAAAPPPRIADAAAG